MTKTELYEQGKKEEERGRGMDTQNICLSNGILFVNEKEGSINRRYSMNGPWKLYGREKKPEAKDHVSYDFMYMKRLK